MDIEAELKAVGEQIRELEKREVELKRAWGACDVTDYELQGPDGPVRLSQAFGDHELMVLVHNMGHQ